MKKWLVSCICLVGMAISPMAAQQSRDVVEDWMEAPNPSQIIFLWGETPPSTNDGLIALFYDSGYRHFQDPRAPRFLFFDRKGRAALGIGGYVKATASYDFGGALPNRDFVTNAIPVPRNPAERSQFQMDASTTRLFLKLAGDNAILGKFVVYVESDFRGGQDYGLQLRQAYVNAHGFLAGQAWSTFVDPAAGPPTVDYEGANGATSVRNVQLRYTFNWTPRWQMALAVESPKTSYTLREGYNRSIRQRMPDLPMYIQYNWGESDNHVRVSGLLRGLSYRDLHTIDNRTVFGWAVQLSGMTHITPRLKLYYQGVYGEGYGGYVNDLIGQGFDLIPDPASPGKLYAPEILGYVAGVQYSFTPRCFASASYSQCRIYPKTGALEENAYRYTQYVVGNAFYKLTGDCNLGVEYLYGRRSNMNRMTGCANRVNAMIQYNF